MLGALALVYTIAYLGHPALPGNSPYPEGWWGWWDQGHYLQCAASLSHGLLTKDTYTYTVGYSLFAAPFYLWTPKHPFFIVDLVFVVGGAGMFFRLARRLVTATETFLFIAVFVVVYRGMLRDSFVIPWNTTPTFFFSYAILCLTALKDPRLREIQIAAVCLGAIYLCKLPEFLCLAPCLLIAIFSLRDRWQIVRVASISALIIGACIVAVLFLNLAVFGHLRTPYEQSQSQIGVLGYSPLWKFYFLFVSGAPIFREMDGMLLSHLPWLFCAVPGFIYVIQRHGRRAAGLVLSIGLCFAVYLNYNDLGSGNLYRYLLIHYFAWCFPLLGLITYVGLKRAWATRLGRWSFCSIPFLVALVCFVTLREKSVDSFVPGNTGAIALPAATERGFDWVLFHGVNSGLSNVASSERTLGPGDFFGVPRPDGWTLLLSNRASVKPLEITAKVPAEVSRVEFGKLVWTFRWSPKWFLYEWARHFVRPHVSVLGRVAGVDLAGPVGVPDGASDEVIQIELPGWVVRQISGWRIELNDGLGNWVSFPNAQGLWPIIADAPADLQPANGNRLVRLCFPDNGNVDTAPGITIRGLDAKNQVVIESIVRR